MFETNLIRIQECCVCKYSMMCQHLLFFERCISMFSCTFFLFCHLGFALPQLLTGLQSRHSTRTSPSLSSVVLPFCPPFMPVETMRNPFPSLEPPFNCSLISTVVWRFPSTLSTILRSISNPKKRKIT